MDPKLGEMLWENIELYTKGQALQTSIIAAGSPQHMIDHIEGQQKMIESMMRSLVFKATGYEAPPLKENPQVDTHLVAFPHRT